MEKMEFVFQFNSDIFYTKVFNSDFFPTSSVQP